MEAANGGDRMRTQRQTPLQVAASERPTDQTCVFCSDLFNFASRRKFRTGLDGLSLLPRIVQDTSATRISPSGVTAIPCGAICWPWPSPCPLSQKAPDSDGSIGNHPDPRVARHRSPRDDARRRRVLQLEALPFALRSRAHDHAQPLVGSTFLWTTIAGYGE
jgi:hypothetical protein